MRDLYLAVVRERGQVCITLSSKDGSILCESTSSKLPSHGTRFSFRRFESAAWPEPIREAIADFCRRERIRIHLQVDSAYADLPWEKLEITDGNPSWIRGVHTPGKIAARGLRVLVVWSDPATVKYPALPHAESEAAALLAAFEASEMRSIEVKEIPNANARAIKNRILSWKPHVVHFIGHCDVGMLGGFLVTETGEEQPGEVHGADLAAWVREAGSRLVVLSGCRSASIAHLLADSGVPAVIGMREPIRDAFAPTLSRIFYAALASKTSIADALEEARRATRGFGDDWSFPVLFSGENASPDAAEPPKTNITDDHNRPFVGRTRERAELFAKLTAGTNRLITLHAMGGMGKTRLARQVGLDIVSHFEDGVWFVDCDAFTAEDQLLTGIANALGESFSGSPEELCLAIDRTRALLILDCFEKIAFHNGALLTILSRCPNIKMLATSRIALEDSDVYALNPLADRKRTSPSERLELFELAARAVNPRFRITASNAKVCRQIVAMLEGVPLAILLAAGRLRHLSLEELRDRLEASLLETLKRLGGKHDRHANLRIVINDSFNLLTAESRELASKLSLFEGGFTLADAHHVLASHRDLDDGIFTLCDHAILNISGVGAETRFRMLDTIGEYVGEITAQALPSEQVSRFVQLFLSKARNTCSGNAPIEVREILSELRNYQAAVRHAAENSDTESIVAFAKLLARPFAENNLITDFHLLSRHVDGLRYHSELAGVLVELKGLEGMIWRRQGEFEKAKTAWTRRAEVCHLEGLDEKAADCHFDIADMNLQHGELDSALENIEMGRVLLGSTASNLHYWFDLLQSKAMQRMGDCDAARALIAKTIAAYDGFDSSGQLFASYTIGEILHGCQDVDAARHTAQAIRVAYRSAKAHSLARCMLLLADIVEPLELSRSQRLRALVLLGSKFLLPRLITAAKAKQADVKGAKKPDNAEAWLAILNIDEIARDC